MLRSNQDLDYRLIGEKIDAQLVVEITGIFQTLYNNNLYQREGKRGEIRRLESGGFGLEGWQFECRAILVESGGVGGIYTIHIAPRTTRFYYGSEVYPLTAPEGADGASFYQGGVAYGYRLSFEAAVPRFVQELIFELKPWTRPSGAPGP